jgi:hypothetical protein
MVKRLSRPRPKQRSEVRALLYRRATAAEMLDTSISGLKRLEREGRLTPKRISASATSTTLPARFTR